MCTIEDFQSDIQISKCIFYFRKMNNCTYGLEATGKKLSKVTKKICLIVMVNYYWNGFNLQKCLIICKVQDLWLLFVPYIQMFCVLQDSIIFFKGMVHHLNVIKRKIRSERCQTNIISFYYRVTKKQMLTRWNTRN